MEKASYLKIFKKTSSALGGYLDDFILTLPVPDLSVQLVVDGFLVHVVQHLRHVGVALLDFELFVLFAVQLDLCFNSQQLVG